VAVPELPLAIYDARADAVTLRVHVVPGAKKSAIDGRHGDRLKVRVAARPIEGEANAALCAFVAGAFGVPPRSVSVVAGHTSRTKTLSIQHPVRRPDVDWIQSLEG
jgi:uncharacterized protein (TIGR00251 family)